MKTAGYLSVAMVALVVVTTGAHADPSTSQPADNSCLPSHAAGNSSEEASANLYYQLSLNEDLAKRAGVPALVSETTSTSLSYENPCKPLVTPDAADSHNSYSAPSPSTAAPLSGSAPTTSPAPKADQSQDPPDIETPGMVAAGKDPLKDTSASDLTLDVLPGETIEQAKAHQENYTKLELALPVEANQPPKAQAVAPTPAQTSKPAPAPRPVSKVPQINPVRSSIANPFDILDR